MTKATKAEFEARLDRTEEIMLTGRSDGAAARELARECGVTTRQGLAYVARVRGRWREAAAARGVDPAEKYGEHRERFAFLFRTALETNQLRVAATAAERLAQLDGFLSGKAPPVGSAGISEDSEVAALLRGAIAAS